jgi:hypothetical protein
LHFVYEKNEKLLTFALNLYMWLTVENVSHEQLIEDNTQSFEEAEKKTE